MIRLALALGVLAAPGAAETIVISGSSITLRDSKQPGAVAEIIFDNRPTNGPLDTGTYSLSHGDLTVTLHFGWDVGAGGHDAIMVDPPAGLVCAPSCGLSMAEGSTGTIWLHAGQWEGM